ncbi:hypothetical protein LCGC14_0368110 [marine sediment metagenome]|uniref:Uncharacterized protein n=1 Tax=marine sediment metagenome TaxID=412755 RepID=A0A0F9TBS3_9ZZZZ
MNNTNTNIMFIEKVEPLIECYICEEVIKGEIKEKNMGVCHPAVLYNTVKVCKTCFNK